MDKTYATYTLHRIESGSVRSASGCLEWRGAKTRKGVGVISFTQDGKRTITTCHRAVYQCRKETVLPKEVKVKHRCKNVSCVEFEHLYEANL